MTKPSLKKQTKRKAAKATARHAAGGTASKAREEPARAAAIVVLGCLALALVGWLVARGGSEEAPYKGA